MNPYQSENDWRGCYKKASVDPMLMQKDAVSHPAKMAPLLLDRIIRTMRGFGWLKVGDTLVDPFGGTGHTALRWCAMHPDNRAATIEIEAHFVAMQQANKAHAERKLGRALPWSIIQGDSRRADTLLAAALEPRVPVEWVGTSGDIIQFMVPESQADGVREFLAEATRAYNAGDCEALNEAFASLDGIVGGGYALKFAALTSPPYGEGVIGKGQDAAKMLEKCPSLKGRDPNGAWFKAMSAGYVNSPGNIDNLPGAFVKYGNEEGQIEGLPNPINDRVAVGCTSPPYEAQGGGSGPASRKSQPDPGVADRCGYKQDSNGTAPAQIGTTEGETYADAVAQVYAACARAGIRYLAVVTKDPTRNGKLRRIGKLTCRLLRAAGYRVVAWRRAWLFETEAQMEARGAHTPTLFNEHASPERVHGRISFFKRLHLAKGRVAAQWEDVFLCVLDSPGDDGGLVGTTSPPYEGDQPCQSQSRVLKEHGYEGFKRGNNKRDAHLANPVAVTSPPYASTDTKPNELGAGKGTRKKGDSVGRNKGDYAYPQSEGQIGALPDPVVVVTSPPYANTEIIHVGHSIGDAWEQRGQPAIPGEKGNKRTRRYGQTEGQIGQLPDAAEGR